MTIIWISRGQHFVIKLHFSETIVIMIQLSPQQNQVLSEPCPITVHKFKKNNFNDKVDIKDNKDQRSY